MADASGRADGEEIHLGFCSKYRLHEAAEFSLVFAARNVLRGKNFDLHYLRRNESSVRLPAGPRLGLVVAKKLAHHAVQRNLLKRLAREVFRHARQSLPSYDLILRLSKSPAGKMDRGLRRGLRTEIDELLIRLPR